ncbi:MAG: ribbon-helix-helix protein, CopG family [Actinobacteria bacterium]|nr:ribbon-helix-helix protein, CopG family [Actinomycetota bacterium]
MVRTQVQLTKEQIEALKKLAGKKHVSVAELVRRGVDIVIRSEAEVSGEELRQRAISAAGKFRSGKPDLSTEHDEYLAEALDS